MIKKNPLEIPVGDEQLAGTEPKKAAKSKKEKALPSKQYVAKMGLVCPVCHTDDISAGDIDMGVDPITAYSNIVCQNEKCRSIWVDCYQLVRYDNLEVNPE